MKLTRQRRELCCSVHTAPSSSTLAVCSCSKSPPPVHKYHWGFHLPFWLFLPSFQPCLGCPAASVPLRKITDRKLPALTPAEPAASANPQRCRALPADRGGLQHSLHVLVLCGILGVLQTLGLDWGGGWGAGELSRLWKESRFVFLTKKSTDNGSASRRWVVRGEA